jgi:hypothetical protein
MADNALLFKYLVKSLGMKYGITPSFMAKPWGNVSVSFHVVDLNTYAFAQLPGCSGFVQNCVVLHPRRANSKIYVLKSYSRIHS